MNEYTINVRVWVKGGNTGLMEKQYVWGFVPTMGMGLSMRSCFAYVTHVAFVELSGVFEITAVMKTGPNSVAIIVRDMEKEGWQKIGPKETP